MHLGVVEGIFGVGGREDDFGVWVGGDEFGDEDVAGEVGYCLEEEFVLTYLSASVFC